MKSTCICVAFLLCLASNGMATMPHTFQAGQAAKASEVNENFKFLNRTNFVLKANGALIGDVISVDYNSATVINSRNFVFKVYTSGAANYPVDTYFSETNCTGSVYVDKPLMNYVFSPAIITMPTYYVLSNNPTATVNVKSYKQYGGTCYNYGFTLGFNLMAPIQNDPSLTGVKNTVLLQYQFEKPITIEER